MSSLHSMKKEIAKRTLMFEPDMYLNTIGSIIISAYILSPEKPSVFEINKRWHQIKKHPKKVNFWLDDPDFIDKTLDLFCMKRPEVFPIAMVQSDFNVLFMPYVEGQLFPLREDGVYPMTASKGKIYPIDFTGKFTNKEGGTDEKPAKREEKDECQEEENQGQTQARQRKQVKRPKQ